MAVQSRIAVSDWHAAFTSFRVRGEVEIRCVARISGEGDSPRAESLATPTPPPARGGE